jgi:hypothetical protein
MKKEEEDQQEEEEEEGEALSNHWTCSIHANMPFALLSKLLTTDCPTTPISHPTFFLLEDFHVQIVLRFTPFQGVGNKINICVQNCCNENLKCN